MRRRQALPGLATGQSEIWLLIPVEVQSQYDASFPQRLYIYNYRAFDLYHRPVVSLAILGDERETWRPSSYQTEFMNCRLRLDYPIVKLLDYAPSWEDFQTALTALIWTVNAPGLALSEHDQVRIHSLINS